MANLVLNTHKSYKVVQPMKKKHKTLNLYNIIYYKIWQIQK